MFKSFFTICLLALSCFISFSQDKLTTQELNKLDKEIKQKYIYDNRKISRIDSLKKTAYSPNENTENRYNALFHLGKEYETFISDSALYYFDQALLCAQSTNDSIKITLSRLGKVKCYAILGYFKHISLICTNIVAINRNSQT